MIYRKKVKRDEIPGEIIYEDEDMIYIIQEYIPGDDSHLFDAVVYCDKKKKVKLVSFAQIGLQEHAPKMIGNAAALINGYSEFPGVTEQIAKIKESVDKVKINILIVLI